MSRARPSAADDARFMARALALAARGLGSTHPNPSVGAVFVRDGRMIGDGRTAPVGGPHAEVRALRAAGDRARGADLYVTLEPCAHHGRTPPCADALLELGLRRVVVAMVDPNPKVRGRGLRRLRAGGVRVTVGVGEAEASRILAGYRSHVLRGRPLVMLKLAATLDGRIAARTGDARWITGAPARRRAHELRAVHDAVLVGAGTVRADDPALTCRVAGGRNPVRIVVAGPRLDLPARARILDVAAAPTWVVTTAGAAAARVARLRRRGVDVVAAPARRGAIPTRALLRTLAARGITSVLVEGGSRVAADLLRAGLVDRVAWFVAPSVLGGDALPAVAALGIARAADAIRLADVETARLGDDVLVTASVRSPSGSRPFASSWPPR
jgi:diaminohydroxyphosphoribosylaminopyrimidine deaminase / 5-amino-6-(5-phosphoribosylamino)uracil reductase